jgi:ABC-2 type transport system permease protein
MSFRRAWGVFLRYFYVCAKLEQIADLFYWPAIDIFVWGMATVWIDQHKEGVPEIALIVLTGIVFWQIVWRGNYEISVNLLQEFWNRNLSNIFSTPLKLGEWILGVILLSICKIFISLSFGALLVFLLYEMNVFTIGWAFLPMAFSLIISGWMIGFFASSVIIYWGQRLQMLAWMTAYLFVPFVAVFYPVSALPSWAQTIALSLPPTYVFEGMRSILAGGPFPAYNFWMSMGLNVMYLTAAIALFKWMFEKSRSKGLARLE